jgi:eukaryotic-like serine/threonine-protein kinase
MAQKKINCWEFKKCNRQPGGSNVEDFGVCPAAVDSSFNGINNGKNAGRICWAVAGTCCEGKVQGTFAEKRRSCVTCDFYQHVQKQEETSITNQKLLKFFSEDRTGKLLLDMTQCRFVRAGERIVTQGEITDKAYIIKRGSCLVIVEKDGQSHPVDHRGKGDIIGATPILTGEPQMAHVEAETDVELWVLEGSMLNNISAEHPELFDFLTEIVASRFDTTRPIAERKISKYIASDIIGRGAFSVIYGGIHAGLKMPVTIKMMKHDLAMNPEFLKSFKNEAKIIAKLNHDNIVRVYDIEERYRTVFIIMERLTGTTLDVLLESVQRLPPQRIVNYLVQICKGLQYAHQHGIVHQDIKPANIFILPDDKIKILDFGLACPVGSENFLTGTPFYMSPEQVQCFPVDQRSDIYSLGLVVYEMLTGNRPFEGKDQWKVMEMRTSNEIPDPATEIPDLPEALRGFILKACARDPSHRYLNISDALEALKTLISDYGLTNGEAFKKNRKVRMFYLVYNDDHINGIKGAVDEFNLKMQSLGVELKAGELIDL